MFAAGPAASIPLDVGEFWTARQRAAHSLHEISYRACFKPQLPRYFIERHSAPGDLVFDPFMGRGTTLVEAALLGRVPLGTDVNPLCARLVRPHLAPPSFEEVALRLGAIDFHRPVTFPEELLVFYHPETLRELCAMRSHLLKRERDRTLDAADDWIRMVALNRLTGHSPGFFSVYTLPPNQAVSVAAQRKINERLKQEPPRRLVPELILRKTRALLKDRTDETQRCLAAVHADALVLSNSAASVPEIADESVQLVVTSPPFLDTVDYVADNWLRAWFAGVGAAPVGLCVFRNATDWVQSMTQVLAECRRVLRDDGHLVFEVGEVRGGKVRLEEQALEAGERAGLRPERVMINAQHFTKTSNCWGVSNGTKGTNPNRIVVFRNA
ncbi:MAG: DNA methyltransferase [Limisphaerales bacterium]